MVNYCHFHQFQPLSQINNCKEIGIYLNPSELSELHGGDNSVVAECK